MLRPIAYFIAARFFRLFFWLLARVEIRGRENIPPHGPYIVIANHFSQYEVPLISILLPQSPHFFAAEELSHYWLMRLAMWINDSIAVRRGQADREALKRAFHLLETGQTIAIFPEGGITTVTIEAGARGELTHEMHDQSSRHDAQLLPARPGAAYVATHSQVPILPIAVLGTEKMGENIKQWKRTPIQVIIGRPFGPLGGENGLRGREKRTQLDQLGHQMMQQLAALVPPENRGVYGEEGQVV